MSWLPEVVTVKLTALEAGALMAVLNEAKRKGIGFGQMNKPGEYGEIVSTTVIEVLIEKAERGVREMVEKYERGGRERA